VTLRTGPPGSPGGEPTTIKAEGGKQAPRKSGAGRALLTALLVVAGALAIAALVFPKTINDLLSTGDGGTTAATTAASTAPGTTAQPATTAAPSTARPDTKPPVGGETSSPGGATASGGTGGDKPRKPPGSVGKTGADTGAKQTPGSGKTMPQSGGGSGGPAGKTAPAPRSGGASGAPDSGSSRKN